MSDTSTTRRVRKSPEQRRTEVSAAAIELALESGLDAVTLRAVAARVGVAPGLVAHYIPSMDVLVAETFGEIVAGELRGVVGLLEGVDAAPQRLGMLIDTVLDGSRRDVTLVWVQGWALGSRNDALAARVRGEMDAWQQMIAAEIERGKQAGAFGEVDADAIAWHLLAMIDGLGAHGLVRWREHPERADLTRRVLAGLLGVAPEALA
ncbi:TetR/AcrR family transcriptional regulator [Microbacterium sp. bgisy189]|uniref:TetR/AcrR family transcriptional regulator n=1 Tax=Microbacterium sp. bgisy189 TaxID=3413798 RepID=UPI003EBB6C99